MVWLCKNYNRIKQKTQNLQTATYIYIQTKANTNSNFPSAYPMEEASYIQIQPGMEWNYFNAVFLSGDIAKR